MTENTDGAKPPLDVQALWSRYEDVAMHFNDLLIRLRLQSLAGIAAVSTLVGLFSKEGITDIKLSWLAATIIFVAMALFWIAIWCLDVLYYNRLLSGAVAALLHLEEQTKAGRPVTDIQLSTAIDAEFSKPLGLRRFRGVVLFYSIVFAVILAGASFCGGFDAGLIGRGHREALVKAGQAAPVAQSAKPPSKNAGAAR